MKKLLLASTCLLMAAGGLKAQLTPTLVKDIRPGVDWSVPTMPVNLGDKIVFVADDGTNGQELWISDGTTAGTTMIKDINSSGPGVTQWNVKIVMNDLVFFEAYEPVAGYELWVSDGTEAGTHLVKDVRSGASGSLDGFTMTVYNNKVYFVANDGTNGYEIWSTDGTEAGTTLLKNINPTGNIGMGNSQMTVFNGMLYFCAWEDNTTGQELWISDGTEAGTVLFKDIAPGALHSFPHDFYVAGSTMYFSASNGTDGQELWKTDGTAVGTVMVKNIHPTDQSQPFGFLEFENKVYFNAAGETASEPWVTDGTEAGTILLKEINPGGFQSNPINFIEFNNMLFFSASNSDTGRELYKSDGTEAGTVLVKDIALGTFVSSIPLELTVFAGELFFTANLEDTDGRELWSTDGTEAGTQMYTDIFPGDEDAFFYDGGYVNMHRNGNTLYLFAINATVGYELFKLEVSDVSVGANESTSTVEVYPNPASQLVTIKNIEPDQMLVIVDVTGKIIHQVNANESSLELDLAAFENGIYFIQIYEDTQLIDTKKLVVSK